MFTGIIETTGKITKILSDKGNSTFFIESILSASFSIDQSVAHNGVCLTVESVTDNTHRVTAIAETLKKTTLGEWEKGQTINLEQCLKLNARLDGHMVQGHVDDTAACMKVKDANGSYEFQFQIDKKNAHLIIEKGSVCLNGISLTIFNVTEDLFTVAIIPYTWAHTNMQYLQKGDAVNVEFDMIGKYVNRSLIRK